MAPLWICDQGGRASDCSLPRTPLLILRCELPAMREHRPEASLEGRTCPMQGSGTRPYLNPTTAWGT